MSERYEDTLRAPQPNEDIFGVYLRREHANALAEAVAVLRRCHTAAVTCLDNLLVKPKGSAGTELDAKRIAVLTDEILVRLDSFVSAGRVAGDER